MSHLITTTFDNREAARADLHRRLDALCQRWGMDPEQAWRRPHFEEWQAARIAAQDALMAQVRADAMRVQGKRARGRDGRFVARASS